MSEPILCYIEGNRAYFTTQSLETQRGDDWNDAPYEHNAGTPYEWSEHNDKDIPQWEIICVYFNVNMQTPENIAYCNSHYSVERINHGAAAWLYSDDWHIKPIMAGTTLSNFKAQIKAAGGRVYVEDTNEAK